MQPVSPIPRTLPLPILSIPRTLTPPISPVRRTPTPPIPVDDQAQQSLLADDLGSFVKPDQHNESSMLNEVPTPCHRTDDDVPVTYEIIPGGGEQQTEQRLIHSLGYSYTKRQLNQEHVTYWR
ncbi:hypothetical protein LSH36_445g02068 [Paralvinella palmiformis]|uniref:Uncharacterized protein n=1 Tax=Paralvinella palmiformis TaxID=53620 RepID=A0AAD9N0D3_9ANNE|nr:hypothetical protein LSH36_445g02068 [Paralvinella palmiformis]